MLNLDEARLEQLVTPRTKAIVPVHYAGVGCDLEVILGIAERHGVAVVEDNAHGLFGYYRGRPLGTFGCLSALSFHETKNFSCGEGGALLINNVRFAERAEILREKGTDRNRFFRGQVDKYTWRDVGSSYLPSDALAALLFAQLEAHERIQTRRRELWRRYREGLADWAAANGVRLPVVPPECGHAFHLFHLLLPSPAERPALIGHLRQHGVHAIFHYLPLHLSDMARRFGGREGDCPVSEAVSDRLVRLPLFYDLDDPDQERVLDAVRTFRVQGGRTDVSAERHAA
jgi:dTDP-4-amino-4,6-dideoxygalactose transaminase